jgi:hypothetical protein
MIYNPKAKKLEPSTQNLLQARIKVRLIEPVTTAALFWSGFDMSYVSPGAHRL